MYQADLYTQNNDLQRRDIKKILQNTIKLTSWNGSGNEMVLDVGCGSGDVTKDVILSNCPKIKGIIGVDVSSSMLDFARKHNAHEKIHYRQLDLTTKSISEDLTNRFDHAFSFHVFHWMKNQRQLFENIYKMLKPGGDLLGHFVLNTDLMTIYELHSQMPKWRNYLKNVSNIFPYQHCKYPQETAEKLLSKAGFSHIIKSEKRQFVYSDREHFKTSMAVINPFIKDVPKNLQDEFMDDFADIAAALELVGHDGVFVVPYNIATVYMRKPII